MKKADVPFYNDPDDFDGAMENKYPCSTQFMEYNPLLHRYTLTEAGLSHYGVDYNRFISDSPNKAQDLANKASKKVYDYIHYKSGHSCYQIMMYRIAVAPKTIYPDQYYMRKQFEEALIEQAKWLVINGDTARFSATDLEGGKKQALPPEDDHRDTNDIAPETKRTLDTLELTRWFKTSQVIWLDSSKY